MGAVTTGSKLNDRRPFRAWLIPALLLTLPLAGHARDPDLPLVSPNVSSPRVSACEGFFTLGHHSELVIGSEERMDQLITSGVLGDQAAVDAWDQAKFADARYDRIKTFTKARLFAKGHEFPAGMKLQLRDLDAPQPVELELFTAALDEQSAPLRGAIRSRAIFNRHTYLARRGTEVVALHDHEPAPGPEVFAVRQSASFVPTEADRADLRRARERFGPGTKVIGVLWLTSGDADVLIVYR